MKLIKSILYTILILLKRIAILVSGAIVIAYVLSRFIYFGFGSLLIFMGLLIMAIGGLSAMGSSSIMRDSNYKWAKASLGIKDIGKRDLQLLLGSYEFCIFMGIAGLIIWLLGSYINN